MLNLTGSPQIGCFVMFSDMLEYVYSESVFNTFRKFPSDKTNGKKMLSFFFRVLQLITVLHLISDSYMS